MAYIFFKPVVLTSVRLMEPLYIEGSVAATNNARYTVEWKVFSIETHLNP